MRWLKHDVSARNDIRLKLVRRKFGMEGYGIYFGLLEIIGERIEKHNTEDWGYADCLYTVPTLSDEFGVSVEKMQEMVNYFIEIGLLEMRDNRLYCEKILKRVDDYAERLLREKGKSKKGQGRKRVGTKFRQSRNSVGTKSDIEQNRSRTEVEVEKNTPPPIIPRPLTVAGDSPPNGGAGEKIISKKDLLERMGMKQVLRGATQEWQDYACRRWKSIGLKGSPTSGFFKLVKKAWNLNQRGILDAAASYVIDANARDPERLFYWRVNQFLARKESG